MAVTVSVTVTVTVTVTVAVITAHCRHHHRVGITDFLSSLRGGDKKGIPGLDRCEKNWVFFNRATLAL